MKQVEKKKRNPVCRTRFWVEPNQRECKDYKSQLSARQSKILQQSNRLQQWTNLTFTCFYSFFLKEETNPKTPKPIGIMREKKIKLNNQHVLLLIYLQGRQPHNQQLLAQENEKRNFSKTYKTIIYKVNKLLIVEFHQTILYVDRLNSLSHHR